MACVGGLLGALFNGINCLLTAYRMKHVHKKRKLVRILEAVLVTMGTTIVAFVAAMTLGDCRRIPDTDGVHGVSSSADSVNATVRTYFCPPGYYNDMATLFFNPQEVAIKQLFHQSGTFSMPSLGIFFVCFFLLACWTYGVAVPSGLFVPSLLCGAAYGRFVANLLQTVFGYKSVYSGTYALIGAAAFLGGVVRMTISLTVILIESTNEISYGLPLMIVLMVAKWVGDLFNKGLYDMHIDLKEVPFLEWETPAELAKLNARDIVESHRLSVVFNKTRVASLVKILKTTAHSAFPVVSLLGSEGESESLVSFENQKENDQVDSFVNDGASSYPGSQMEDMADINFRRRSLKFEGTVLRSHIAMLLKRRTWFREGEQPPTLTYEELTADYPRYPDVYDLLDTELELDAIVDISHYCNRCPYTVYPESPVPQVFALFRSMGLRHLPVVDHDGKLQGIITRHNLTHEYMEGRLHRHQQRQQRLQQEH
ncbi:H(+)/Cl(-) exchange transporter 6-like [Littorina saxatilis]|uniref:H(+)/Cl(-) exchange transporter 6-like n=1 Tax=Littorina saxatilis TaxID=31220 RepID=UPI0038B697ED